MLYFFLSSAVKNFYSILTDSFLQGLFYCPNFLYNPHPKQQDPYLLHIPCFPVSKVNIRFAVESSVQAWDLLFLRNTPLCFLFYLRTQTRPLCCSWSRQVCIWARSHSAVCYVVLRKAPDQIQSAADTK